jgi:hypothetical protein
VASFKASATETLDFGAGMIILQLFAIDERFF